MPARQTKPKVSIGLVVYNGSKSISAAIESFLDQTFRDFELIISDNASSDETEAICHKFASLDDRICYIRHPDNIGAAANFQYVLGQSLGEYFTWAAHDDIRSPEYLEKSVEFLDANSIYVASTSPNCMDDQQYSLKKNKWVKFGLEGRYEQRLLSFLDNFWLSCGIFCSLLRISVIKSFVFPKESFMAWDWVLNLFLVSRGPIHRSPDGYIIFGRNGLSNSKNCFRVFRSRYRHWLLPLYDLSCYALIPSHRYTLKFRAKLVFRLICLNMNTARAQILHEIRHAAPITTDHGLN